MKLILDTNILFSALIKSSLTRSILLSPYFEFYMPEYALFEIEKHIDLLEKKSGLTKGSLEVLIDLLTENVQIIPAKEFEHKLPMARKTMENIDPDDAPFLALALAIPNDGIWSEDKGFQKQKLVDIRTTREMKRELDSLLEIDI